MSHTPTARNAGFSLVEIIIVVAVMAILATLTTPALIQFMQKRDEQTEQNILLEIERALALYATANNALPSDRNTNNPSNDTWFEALASYTNLSATQLETDTWGNPRAYISHTVTENFLDSSVEIAYISVHSRGVNRDVESISGIASTSSVDGNIPFAAPTARNWWKNQSNPTLAFSNIQPDGDDLMIKYTNYQQVVDNYNTTLTRLKNLSQALENYAQNKYTEALVYDNSLPDSSPRKDPYVNTRIYYPLSTTQVGTDSARYSPFVTSDMASFNFGGDNRIHARTSTALRRNEMIQLMRLLGLPDSNCCNALERFTSGGESLEVPFYYFSNPRPRVGAGCGSRPGRDETALPARITTTLTSSTCG